MSSVARLSSTTLNTIHSAQGEVPPPQHSATSGHEPSEEHVDGLLARPYWDAVGDSDRFPWAEPLEAAAKVIIDEFESNLLASAANDKKSAGIFQSDSVWQNQVMGTGWSAVRLQRLGVWNMENCQQFPAT
jgi:hypothetical protein